MKTAQTKMFTNQLWLLIQSRTVGIVGTARLWNRRNASSGSAARRAVVAINGSASTSDAWRCSRFVPTVSITTMSDGPSRITSSPAASALAAFASMRLPSHLGGSACSRPR